MSLNVQENWWNTSHPLLQLVGGWRRSAQNSKICCLAVTMVRRRREEEIGKEKSGQYTHQKDRNPDKEKRGMAMKYLGLLKR
jgi:hypothetical protein